jgi:tRNA pseudouridine13 synthase
MAIKKLPEDFIVEEILDPAVAARISEKPAGFAVYRLSKKSLSTPEATSGLARQLGLRQVAVQHAGLKDKHAQTIQHVTVQLPGGRELPEKLTGPQWSAERLGYLGEEITSQAIAANRFHITIRTLTQKDLEKIQQRVGALKIRPAEANVPARRLLAVNYFGDQRFGSARSGGPDDEETSGGFIAPLLIRGKFEEAMKQVLTVHHRKDQMRVKQFKKALAAGWGKWRELLPTLPNIPEIAAVRHLAGSPEDFRGAFAQLPYLFQQMVVDAYQSLLWNRIARRFVETMFTADQLIVAEDRFGDMVFVRPEAVNATLMQMDLPILGEDARLDEPWRAAAESVLAEENIRPASLRIPGLRRPQFRTVSRNLFVVAEGFTMDSPVADELQPKAPRKRLTVHFDLPRGSYATVVLRAIGS